MRRNWYGCHLREEIYLLLIITLTYLLGLHQIYTTII